MAMKPPQGRGIGVGPADIDVMRPAIDPIDDEVMAVVELVGEPVPHDATDELALAAAGRVEYGEVAPPPHHAFPGQLAVHGLDDVTAFAHAAEHRLEVGGK